MKVLILVENEFEDLELFYPFYRMREEGIDVEIASSSLDVRVGKKGYAAKPDLTYEDVKVEEYAALILPGGKSPERVRVNERAVEIVKKFLKLEKPVAAICHGPQLLISAMAVITSRMPDDLPHFCRELVKMLKRY
jgi:protease I